jgi:magnesium chelatase family protein
MSTAALIGSRRRPGLVSVAHAGVLYLDQAADHPTTSVNALRQVLDDEQVILGPGHLVYPARLLLVLASTGCPAAETDCTCPPAQRRRYHARLAVLLDRVDLRLTLPTLDQPTPRGESTAAIAERVATARTLAAARWRRLGQPASTNITANCDALKASLRRSGTHLVAPLRRAIQLGTLSARGGIGVLRLAWSLADLSHRAAPNSDDLAEAITLRTQPF